MKWDQDPQDILRTWPNHLTSQVGYCGYAWDASTLENLGVDHSDLQGDVLDTSETAQMEAVEPPLVPLLRCPELAAVEKSAEHEGPVYRRFQLADCCSLLSYSV